MAVCKLDTCTGTAYHNLAMAVTQKALRKTLRVCTQARHALVNATDYIPVLAARSSVTLFTGMPLWLGVLLHEGTTMLVVRLLVCDPFIWPRRQIPSWHKMVIAGTEQSAPVFKPPKYVAASGCHVFSAHCIWCADCSLTAQLPISRWRPPFSRYRRKH